MRKGFSYIQILVALSLSLCLLATLLTLTKQILYTISSPPRIVGPILDTLSTDIRFATSVQHNNNTIHITTANDAYMYEIYHQRFAKRREGLLYLSPVTPAMTEFNITNQGNTYTVALSSTQEAETRIIRRRN